MFETRELNQRYLAESVIYTEKIFKNVKRDMAMTNAAP